MEISLLKKQCEDFTINEKNCKEFDFEDIMFIAGTKYEPVVNDKPKYVAFKTRDEFINGINEYDVDKTKKVLINDKGYFFCPVKNGVTITESKEIVNESADTEENKAE